MFEVINDVLGSCTLRLLEFATELITICGMLG